MCDKKRPHEYSENREQFEKYIGDDYHVFHECHAETIINIMLCHKGIDTEHKSLLT